MQRAFVIATLILLQACSNLRGNDSDTAAGVLPADSAAATGRAETTRPRADAAVMAAFERANDAIDAQEWDRARDELQWLVEHHPQFSGPLLNLALVHQVLDEPDRAEPLFRQALEVNPGNIAAYNQYALFLRKLGRFHEAERVYLSALETAESHADTHRNIGVLYELYIGDQQRALQHFSRYQELAGSEEVMIAGWIANLQRQLLGVARGEQAL